MPSTTTFLTTPMHEKLECDSANTDSTNRHKTIDQNLKTTWDPGTSTLKYVRFDTNLDSGVNITHGGVWIRNYDDDSNFGSLTINFEDSVTSGSGYAGGGSATVVLGDNGLFFFDLTSDLTKRYLQVEFDNLPVGAPSPLVAQILFLTERQITSRPEYPLSDPPRFFNKVKSIGGGVSKVDPESLNYVRTFKRNFTLIDSADKTVVDNIFIDLDGRRRQFIYQEGAVVADAFLCRMRVDNADIKEQAYQFYKANFNFWSEPYIESGEVL